MDLATGQLFLITFFQIDEYKYLLISVCFSSFENLFHTKLDGAQTTDAPHTIGAAFNN